jgi:hypothetical protein
MEVLSVVHSSYRLTLYCIQTLKAKRLKQKLWTRRHRLKEKELKQEAAKGNGPVKANLPAAGKAWPDWLLGQGHKDIKRHTQHLNLSDDQTEVLRKQATKFKTRRSRDKNPKLQRVGYNGMNVGNVQKEG